MDEYGQMIRRLLASGVRPQPAAIAADTQQFANQNGLPQEGQHQRYAQGLDAFLRQRGHSGYKINAPNP